MEPEIQHAHILHYQVPEISMAQWNIYKVIGEAGGRIVFFI